MKMCSIHGTQHTNSTSMDFRGVLRLILVKDPCKVSSVGWVDPWCKLSPPDFCCTIPCGPAGRFSTSFFAADVGQKFVKVFLSVDSESGGLVGLQGYRVLRTCTAAVRILLSVLRCAPRETPKSKQGNTPFRRTRIPVECFYCALVKPSHSPATHAGGCFKDNMFLVRDISEKPAKSWGVSRTPLNRSNWSICKHCCSVLAKSK